MSVEAVRSDKVQGEALESMAKSLRDRANFLFDEVRTAEWIKADRIFAKLMTVEWLAAILLAIFTASRSWEGERSYIDPNLLLAVFLGGLVTIVPVVLTITQPGRQLTRTVIAIGQMLMCTLAIQLTGGRIETHFMVFVSLAFLQFYRDIKVLVAATVVIAVHHIIMGWIAPTSVYGTALGSHWRWAEHAAWVIFEDVVLVVAIRQALEAMRMISDKRAELECANRLIQENAERALEESEERTRLIVENSLDGIVTCNEYDLIIGWNKAAEAIFGWTEREALGKLLSELIMPERYRAAHMEGLKRVIANGEEKILGRRIEIEAVHKLGHEFQVELAVTALRSSRGVTFSGFVRDITDRKVGEHRLKSLNAVLQNAVEGISRLDATGAFVSVNSSFAAFFGYAPDEMLGMKWQKTVVQADQGIMDAAYSEMFVSGRAEAECRAVRKDGSKFYQQVTLIAAYDEEQRLTGNHCFLKDVTERKELEERVSHQAMHDTLSGLPNRRMFVNEVSVAMARSRGETGSLAMMYIDVDNFKFVNDSLGHDEGDRLLVEVANRISKSLPPGALLARMGGDEFTVLMAPISSGSEPQKAAEEILKSLAEPIRLRSREVVVSVSIGIATNSELVQSVDDLMKNADTAMYQTKLAGKSGFGVFDSSMNERMVERLELEIGLRNGLENGEFVVHYQPIIELKDGRLTGAEALVRWNHPLDGLVSPIKFIPIAEETGLIVQIGAWVLETACRQAVEWRKDPAMEVADFCISVNLSGRQLQDHDLVSNVSDILTKTGLPPHALKLEITESVMMENIEASIQKLSQLRELGVQLAVDDFGTGYSSLSCLRRLPVDTVKIDKSFVDVMGDELEPTAVVRSIISLCRALNLRVTGEGIESFDQMVQLQALGCDYGQGYLFSRPLEAGKFEEYRPAECLAKFVDFAKHAQKVA